MKFVWIFNKLLNRTWKILRTLFKFNFFFSSAYEEGRFCETFHLNASGWRCCESCGKVSWRWLISINLYALSCKCDHASPNLYFWLILYIFTNEKSLSPAGSLRVYRFSSCIHLIGSRGYRVHDLCTEECNLSKDASSYC